MSAKLPIIFQCQKLLEPLAKLVAECDIFPRLPPKKILKMLLLKHVD